MTLRILAMVEIICYNAVRQNVKGVHGDAPPFLYLSGGGSFFSVSYDTNQNKQSVSAFYDFFFGHIH